MSDIWTEEQDAYLKLNYPQGILKTREMALELGVSSKNKVIGRAHILGLKYGVMKAPPVPVIEARVEGCQFPYNHPFEDDFHFCGQPTVTVTAWGSDRDSSYCEEHHRACNRHDMDKKYIGSRPHRSFEATS